MIVPFLATFLLRSGVWLALLCALVGLGFAYYLIRWVISCSPGNERMLQIAGAVQEGAKAYLNRQIISVSLIAAVIFVILIFTRGILYFVWFPDRRRLFDGSRIHRDAYRRAVELSHRAGCNEFKTGGASSGL